jgi:hypothetical protein
LPRLNVYPLGKITDFVVLTKSAEKVTGAHEDGSRAVATNERTLLSEMSVITGYPRLTPCSAIPSFAFQPVHAT